MVGALDHEIDRWRVFAGDSGTDAGVAGLQCTVFESGIVMTDGFVESRLTALVEAIVKSFSPIEIGPEFAASPQVYRYMDAEPVLARHRVNEVIERRFACQGVVMSDGIVVLRYCGGRN